MEKIVTWVKEDLLPKIPENMFFLFLKNGTFSDKFNFRYCAVRRDVYEVALSLLNINYDALMLGAGGITEVVVREQIKFHEEIDRCIYRGMPLRPEFRVFYDFDKKKVLYSRNYWDYEYCHDAIARNATDKLVYEETYSEIQSFYIEHKDAVEQLVGKHMKNVTGLTGSWSVDILYDRYTGMYYLIDMAVAKDSAYWVEP